MVSTETIPTSDIELARASAAGNEVAFEQIYRAHVRKVYSLCLRLLGNSAEAEDVMQDVFVQLHRKIGTFQGEAALSTWLYRLTVNTVLMHLRRKKRKPMQEPIGEGSVHSLAEESRSRRQSEATLIDRMALERALRQLPNGYRSVLVLHDVEGYEHEEIARMLGIRAGTSKSQLHKARLRMRSLLVGKRLMQPERAAPPE
ncbi:MAG: sigma-70 family RNA polymerase sigma factor [Acidobacteriota bacterium]|nr:sigma-70 family RNA polymerase sigma factor [Blastocatellia bacterium]MDW8238210.1 sigma-70 family RNA polymerase sigma factor [Acidobacteriota bacterium]